MFSERATPEVLRAQQRRKVQDACAAFFTEAIAVSEHPTFSQHDKQLEAVIDRFRDFLADEQEGDDAVIAREIRSRLSYEFARSSSDTREDVLHFLCEAAPIMSDIELDELKRFAAAMYFNDADKLALEKAERKRFAHMLRDAITAAEGLHDAPVSHEEESRSDDLLAREYNTFLETLAFDDAGDELRDMYRTASLTHDRISQKSHARVLEILRAQAHSSYCAELVVRGMHFYTPEYSLWKTEELAYLRMQGGVEIPQEELEKMNIFSAINEILAGDRTYLPYSFNNFFPSREHVRIEDVQRLITLALDRYEARLASAVARFHQQKMYYRIPHLFTESLKLFHALFHYISFDEARVFEQRLQEIFRREGGEGYTRYLDGKAMTHDPEPVHSDVEEHKSKPEEPVGPLVPEREQMLLPDKVIERIRARGLLHLSEEIRQHPDRFAAALKDVEVQRVAREAILRALQQERFGIAERAGPVFLGKDWRKEPAFQEVVRAFLLDQRRTHYFASSVHPLPLAVLQKKAEDFGFSWDEIEEEARQSARKHKRT